MRTTKVISVIRSMSSDDWYWLLQAGSAVVALLAFTILAATTLVGRSINRRDSARLISLEKDLVNARVALSKQEQETAESKKALLELQERARPRRLDPDVKASLSEFLKIGPHTPVEIAFVSGSTTEPLEFARDIRAALESGGWIVTKSTGGAYMGVVPTGLIIKQPEELSLQDEALNLQKAFESAGLVVRVVRDPSVKAADKTLVFVVGLKP